MGDAKVAGKVHLIEETKSYGQKGFRKRVVVLEQDKGRFANYIPVEFTHEGCDPVDQLSLGDEIEVTYQLSGRKWQRDESSEVKFFLNASASGFKLLSGGGGGESEANTGDSVSSANDAFFEAADDSDDVPF